MDRKNIISGLNNAPVAGDFSIVAATGFIYIKYLPQVNQAWRHVLGPSIYRVDTLPIAEAVKVTEVAAVTVDASTKYKLTEQQIKQFSQGWTQNALNYGYTAPAVLGAQATENHNMFVSLAAKINGTQNSHVTAYPVISIAGTQTTGTAQLIGEIVTGATSGAQGVLIGYTATLLTIALIGSTAFANGEVVADETGNTFTTNAAPTLGIKMRIVDDGDYFNAKGTIGGVTTWLATAGFATTDVTAKSKIVSVTSTAVSPGWPVGAIVYGDVTYARGKVLANTSTTVTVIELLGDTNFSGSDNAATDGTTAQNISAVAAAVASNSRPGMPYYAYSQGQGARLLQNVPVLERTSDNYAQGLPDGPTGDTPTVGVSYVQIDIPIDFPGAGDPVARSVGFNQKALRYYVPLDAVSGGTSYATTNTGLDAVGFTD